VTIIGAGMGITQLMKEQCNGLLKTTKINIWNPLTLHVRFKTLFLLTIAH
jgi:hypothetical protein